MSEEAARKTATYITPKSPTKLTKISENRKKNYNSERFSSEKSDAPPVYALHSIDGVTVRVGLNLIDFIRNRAATKFHIYFLNMLCLP